MSWYLNVKLRLKGCGHFIPYVVGQTDEQFSLNELKLGSERVKITFFGFASRIFNLNPRKFTLIECELVFIYKTPIAALQIIRLLNIWQK